MNKLLSITFIIFLLSSCSGGVRIDNVPMYGQPEESRSPEQLKADQDFIETASKEFGGSEKASTIWYLKGDEYFSQKNYDYAMRRYNQSWLLNPDNYQPYWGFGRVMLQINEFKRSVTYFKSAKELVDDDFQKVALLGDYGAALSYAAVNEKDKTKKDELFMLAEQQFRESTALDSEYGNTWRQWAFSLWQQGKNGTAQKKLVVAESLGSPYPQLREWLKPW